MSEDITPFGGTASEDERRAFLLRVEQALRGSQRAEQPYLFDYRPLQPFLGRGISVTALAVRCEGLVGEAQVVAVSFVRRIATTAAREEPIGGLAGAALDQLRASLRARGIAAVVGQQPRYDPFPNASLATYELSILVPAPPRASTPGQPQSAWRPIDHATLNDPHEVARRIDAWRDASRGFPPEPRSAASLKPLQSVARARQTLLDSVDRQQVEALRQSGDLAAAWRLASIVSPIDPERAEQPGAQLTTTAQAQLRADLAALLPLDLLWHVPRDDRGQLALGEQVLLASYDSALPLSKDRQLWLCASAPAKRRDPQVLTLQLAALIGENHSHVWTNARWRWDARAETAPLAERWGVDELPLERLGWESWRDLPDLSSDASALLSPAERAARSIALQDAGRLREALALYDVDLDADVERLVAGERIEGGELRLTEAWARATQEALRQAALWRFGSLLRDAAQARERWVREKRSRKWSAPGLRLLWLPHQTVQSKLAVMLRAHERDGSRPRLELESSASNARLPLVAWQRPLELDLLRFGLVKQAGPV